MRVITISSSFGAGGSVVAGLAAEALGWTLVNRAIPAAVAEHLSVPVDVALANDEGSESRFGRALARAAMLLSAEAGQHLPSETFSDGHAFRQATESVVNRAA